MPPSDPSFIGAMGHNVKRHISTISDGTSNTILIAEDAGRNQKWVMGVFTANSGPTGAWGNPGNELAITGLNPAASPPSGPGPCAVNCTNNNEIYSFHDQLANVAFCDGGVRSLRSNTDVNIVIHLVTRRMNDPVPSDLD